MLIQIFHSDANQQGLDKIDLIGIKEDDENLIVRYDLVNSDPDNDEEKLAPFLIVQVPKSKKNIMFIANGTASGKRIDFYVD
ncbi:hypothetical protein GCM10007103_17140 [Salinimicrobium marinum]|uniref:Uncharacterized protein n=1 Tax=Salinimicrobium marinum TaxID=680283 RepID=A0A918VWN8_9FLAO|nr:hypothetical protein [Salinimicrobium marinum]GHA36219.1 hypothetical protein GCM10007103_17140 [Salinimicrobium marinum]